MHYKVKVEDSNGKPILEFNVQAGSPIDALFETVGLRADEVAYARYQGARAARDLNRAADPNS